MILGIDADSRRLAFAAIEGGTLTATGTISRANTQGRIHEDYDQRLTRFFRRAGERGARIFLEDIFLAKGGAGNVRGFAAMAEVRGEVKRAARLCAVPVTDVNPSTWHSAVLGFTTNRDKLKDAAMAKARELDPDRQWTQHEADSACIGLYGQAAGQGGDDW